MRFAGRVYKDGKFWLAELPILDAMTQGRTRREAFAMVADLLETLVDRPGFTERGRKAPPFRDGDIRPLESGPPFLAWRNESR